MSLKMSTFQFLYGIILTNIQALELNVMFIISIPIWNYFNTYDWNVNGTLYSFQFLYGIILTSMYIEISNPVFPNFNSYMELF